MTASPAETGGRGANGGVLMNIRLMMVAASQEKRQARILLTGSWLDRFGFLPEMLVTASCHKDILTLKACGMGLDCYRQVVGEVRKQKQQLLQAFQWTRQKTETHLVVEGAWLERQGFRIGDVLLISFKQGLIRIKRLQLSEFGFSYHPDAIYQILRVQKIGLRSQITLNVHYLEEHGFLAGQTANVTYEPNRITLVPCKEPSRRKAPSPMPDNINIRSKDDHSCMAFSGAWLLEWGYHPGDLLIIQYHPGMIQIQKLESHHFSF